jgi:cystathionine gamma-synthase
VPPLHLETLAIHAGSLPELAGDVSPAIHLSTTFERSREGGLPAAYLYSRMDNPNRHALEDCLRTLEGGAACAAFASGLAATMSIFQALRPGDHVIAPRDIYYGTGEQLRAIFAPWGLTATFVDMIDPQCVRDALGEKTALVWVESPSNPMIRVADIAAIGRIAHEAGARLAVDNTWATPVLQRPFELGADVVMHSTTKYLGGHDDVLGGAVVVREEDDFFRRIRHIQTTGGAVPSPFECWLVLRGVRTLPLRMRAHCESAMVVATFLARHPAVEAVHYPGLSTHSGHEVARRQMPRFGGMLSVQVHGGRAAALRVQSEVTLFKRATSLGGPQSLIEHRASVEGPTTRTPENLLRLSVGLEHVDDLIADLENALPNEVSS